MDGLTFLQPVIHRRVDINAVIDPFSALLPLLLPPDVLLVVRQRDVEVERLGPLREPEPDEGVLPRPVLDPEHEVAGRVERRLDGLVPLPWHHAARGEELPRVGVLEPDLAPLAARHHAEAARPDLVGLQPLAALVAAAGGPGRDLVDGDLAGHKEGVLEGVLLLERGRHGGGRRAGGCFATEFGIDWWGWNGV